MTVVEIAPAKINLALHVRRRRPDGYHDIETLFAFCRDGDVVTVTPADRPSFAIHGPFSAGLGTGADNLVMRAAAGFAEALGVDDAHAITLDKRLPIASGIGGGSADAAATLRALARLHGIDLADDRLRRLAASLGADVPACLLGLTAVGTGKGDDLTPVDGLTGMPALLVNPGVAVSTAAVFAGWDGVDHGPVPAGDVMTRALAGRNDLEPPALSVAPAIAAVRDLLVARAGVRLARMSGSGATCFALFDTPEARTAAAVAARGEGWWTLETFLA